MNEQKRRYQIRNWREYNAALVERGSLTVWFDDDHRGQWYAADRSGRRGAPRRYSDVAVQCGLVIREVFPLPLRALEGLMRSVIHLLGAGLATPDYSPFSRRAAALPVRIGRCATRGPGHLVMDSTGLKIYGEGEWPVWRHGASRRRTWRKLHLAVDAESQEVIAAEVTAAGVRFRRRAVGPRDGGQLRVTPLASVPEVLTAARTATPRAHGRWGFIV